MKKLILLELALLFLATTFQSDNPPGWYQQTLPVNDFVNDIFFLDSLNGWIVTQGNYNANDTSYIMRTLNGGNNWIIQEKNRENLNAVQFLDDNTGYAVGGTNGTTLMSIYKTNNGGTNWIAINNLTGVQLLDLFFVNNDTGWVCDDNPLNGGVFKTTNGGGSWVRQLDQSFKPTKLFFLNKDTGWVSCNFDRLYRTINGGTNWDLQFTSAFNLGSIFFLNGHKGWIRGGPDLAGNGASYSTDGGFTWTSSQGTVAGGYDIKFVNDSIGYSGGTLMKIPKSTDGGKTFGYQVSSILTCLQTSFLKENSLWGWMGSNGFIRTTDGGGLIVEVEQSGIKTPDNFILYQNYPNPFNPVTVISYQLSVNSNVELKVFNVEGKEIAELVNGKQIAGEYKVEFQSNGLSSGIYFYRIEITEEKSNKVFTDTKKMILVR